jgi:hypothetical protein
MKCIIGKESKKKHEDKSTDTDLVADSTTDRRGMPDGRLF